MVASVLFVDSYPQSLYGQQQTMMALLARCEAAGVSPTVATPGEGPFTATLRRAGFRVVVKLQPEATGRYGGAVYRDGLFRKVHTAASALGYVRRLRNWLQVERFDGVYCNDMRSLLTFGLAARLAGVPVLIWDKLDQPHGMLDILQLPLVSRNIVISPAVLEKYPRWQRRLFSRRIRILHNGVAISDFAAASASSASARSGEIVVAIAGSISPRKGHDLLLPAFRRAQAEVPELRLQVIGDAPEGENPDFRDRLISEAGIDATIRWLGRRSDMPEVIAGIDILVSPSRREGMGRVNVEAMAAGKPVIGALGTGIAEVVVEGETGFLVDPTDEAALADRILRLARDPELRARMGAAGQLRAAAEFDQDRQLGKVLDELLDLAR